VIGRLIGGRSGNAGSGGGSVAVGMGHLRLRAGAVGRVVAVGGASVGKMGGGTTTGGGRVGATASVLGPRGGRGVRVGRGVRIGSLRRGRGVAMRRVGGMAGGRVGCGN
jgi:hypothetical protein